jgi:hypothetical protein
MYNFLVTTHSIFRWILAISLVTTIIYAAFARTRELPFKNTGMLAKISFNLMNLQFVFGIILYFVSPKVIFSSLSMKAPLTRFFLVEHLTGMLIAIALISIGYSVSKKAANETKKYNKLLVFYTIGFLVILAAIPWPFYNLGTDWL